MNRKFFIGLAALLALAAFSAAYAQEQTAQKLVAVVVPFDSSGVPQEEVDVLDRMFLSEFARTGKCTVVDRSSFDKIRAQQNFQLSDWSNSDKVAKLGKALNASVVVTGQVMRFRTQVMFVTQILDVNSTEIISSADKQVNDVAVLFGKFGEMCRTLTNRLPEPPKPPIVLGKYKAGDKGPGGGYVFYYSEEGFPVGGKIYHYLECAPTGLGDISWCLCPLIKDKKGYKREFCNLATTDGIGAGKSNTLKIINGMHPGGRLNASNCAAYACNSYFTGTTKAGEWYLPSKMELNLICKNLVMTGIINDRVFHWSSSQGSDRGAWWQSFYNGKQGYNTDYYSIGKRDKYCVRAVRAFNVSSDSGE